MPSQSNKLRFGLDEVVIEKINKIFSVYHKIQQVIVYGSRAKGNYRPSSDIDLVIEGKAITLSQLLKIENELDDLLLPYKMDLSLLHKINSEDLLDHIKRVGVTFYKKS